MRRLVPALLLFFLAAAGAEAQDLLPVEFAGWQSSSIQRARPENLEQLAGPDATYLSEYHALAAERRDYARGGETLRATLYRMRDPSAAYGAFTFLRTEEMTASDATPYAAISPQRALIVVGHLLVDISGRDLTRFAADWKPLVEKLTPSADTAPFPPYSTYMPAQGMEKNSERYLVGPLALNRLIPLGNGDWVGFSDGAEVQMARYRRDGQDMTLLLVAYPTPQMASAKLAEFGRWFNLNAERKEASNQPVLFGNRRSSLVVLVAETRSAQVAGALLKEVRYESEVTLNEPSYTFTGPNIGEVVIGTFYGIGIFMLFAIVAGIGFGGIRLITKRFFPGKVFDRPGSVEILQLGLGSKPIKGEDFY